MSRTIRQTWRVENVLTDVTSAVLSDPTGTYGVKRNDTSAVVVADGTAMAHTSTGVYDYTFTEPAAGLAYTAYVEIVYDGLTYHFEHDLAAIPAASTALTVTYAILNEEISTFVGYGRDPDVHAEGSDEALDIARIRHRGILRVLNPPPIPGEKYGHEWSFLKPTSSFTTTTPYTTGTVTIVSGVVTLLGGTFPSWATQGSLVISSGTYTVDSRDGNTQITLHDTTVNADAGTTYSLGRTVYDLPTDFAGIEGPLVYASGQSLLRVRVDRMSEHQLLLALSQETTASYPRLFAIRPKAIDMTAATAYEMILSPTPDAAYNLWYKYLVTIPDLDATTNTIPPGGDVHGELYIEACLAAAEQRLHDTQGLHSARFMECLIASVSKDRVLSCPETLGVQMDALPSAEMDPEDHFWTQPDITRYAGYPP